LTQDPRLTEVKKGKPTLLDQTASFSDAKLGNASSNRNLFVSHLEHLGLETDKFTSGSSTLNGLTMT
jgi:hypothetical protein